MPWPDRSKFLLSLSHALKLKWWMDKEQTQVIHCYEHDLYPFAVALRAVTSLPLVCHFHFAVERQFSEWAFGGTRKQPDAIIWTSRQQQEDCRAAIDDVVPPERQYVIPLGLDLTRFGVREDQREPFRQQLGISPDAIVVGSACALRPRKRVDDFLALIRALHYANPNVVGMMAGGVAAGDEAYAAEVIPRIKALEATGRFFWLGFLEPIEPFIQATDIFVSTSEYETFGMSVLEAMACGKPVVAYRGGSVYEIVDDAGLIVETGAQDELLAAVQSLIADKSLRDRLGAAARQRVADEYDPRKSLIQIKGVYATVMRQSAPRRR
jgi:glycosyltransferase involved in cell wall biosynthesis